MKTTILGYVLAMLLLLSAFLHAFLGWPPLAAALEQAGVDAELRGALGAGWHFGSACMFGFGVIVASESVRRRRGEPVRRVTLHALAGVYLVFGALAYLLRGYNPHFLGFVLIGGLLASFGELAQRRS